MTREAFFTSRATAWFIDNAPLGFELSVHRSGTFIVFWVRTGDLHVAQSCEIEHIRSSECNPTDVVAGLVRSVKS